MPKLKYLIYGKSAFCRVGATPVAEPAANLWHDLYANSNFAGTLFHLKRDAEAKEVFRRTFEAHPYDNHFNSTYAVSSAFCF